MTDEMPMGRKTKSFAVFMLALFIVSAIVQYNDPDPVHWIVFYALSAAQSVLFLLNIEWRWRTARFIGFFSVILCFFIVKDWANDAQPVSESLKEFGGCLISFLWARFTSGSGYIKEAKNENA